MGVANSTRRFFSSRYSGAVADFSARTRNSFKGRPSTVQLEYEEGKQKLWYDLEIEMQKAAKLFWSEGKNAFICFVHYLNWLLLCCSSEKQITKKNFLYRADHSMHFLLFPARPSQHLSLIQGHQNHYSWGDLMNFSLSALDDAMLSKLYIGKREEFFKSKDDDASSMIKIQWKDR